MKIVRILGISFVMLVAVLLKPSPIGAEEETENPGMELASPSAVLMEPQTGEILFEKNAHEALRPASVTKIMTILLTMDAVRDGRASLSDMVSVSANAAGYGGSTILLEEGESISLENLVKGMCIASGNDAAIAAAEYIGGSEESFVQMMNQRAEELGMRDTHFVNPCGLDADGHVTSAYDIALMSRELILNYPQILEYTSIWHEMMPHVWRSGPGETDMANTNKLIQSYEGMRGLKTGFTRLARYSLSAVAQRGNLTLIAVIMGAETKDLRSAEVVKLLDYGFGRYTMHTLETDGTEAGYAPLTGGVTDRVPVKVSGNISCLGVKGDTFDPAALTTRIEWKENLEAPVAAGDTVGTIYYEKDGAVVGERPLVTARGVEKAELTDRLIGLFRSWACILETKQVK